MELSPDLNELLGLFLSRNIEFLIVGAHALAHHGAPRFTGDLDILVNSTEENANRIVAALEEFGFTGLGLGVPDFTTPDSVIQLGHPPSRLDILTTISGVEWQTAASGSVEGQLGSHSVRFLGRKELIRNKAATGRTRDRADIEALEAGTG